MNELKSRRVPSQDEKGPGVLPWESFQVWLNFNGGSCALVTENSRAAYRIRTPDGDVVAMTGDVVAFDERGNTHVYRKVLPGGHA